MKTFEARLWVTAALALAIVIFAFLLSARYAGAGVTCTTYGGKGPGGWKWSQTTCR